MQLRAKKLNQDICTYAPGKTLPQVIINLQAEGNYSFPKPAFFSNNLGADPKSFILGVWQCFEYASEDLLNSFITFFRYYKKVWKNYKTEL